MDEQELERLIIEYVRLNPGVIGREIIAHFKQHYEVDIHGLLSGMNRKGIFDCSTKFIDQHRRYGIAYELHKSWAG